MHLQNFKSLDAESFATLMRHLGFRAAACYRWQGEALVLTLSFGGILGEVFEGWPAAVTFTYDHTSPEEEPQALVGWTRLAVLPIARKGWPKGATFYFPEQAYEEEKIAFAVVHAVGKRSRSNDLSGPLEAVASRLRAWYRDQADRQKVVESGLSAHLTSLGIDLKTLIDHELRTPLTSVAGYASLLAEADPVHEKTVWQDAVRVLTNETGNALEAIDKLSVALYTDARFAEEAPRLFDAAHEVQTLCERAREKASELIGADASRRTQLRFQKATDDTCLIEADSTLFSAAVWEVLKNAIIHARTGKIDVLVYQSDGSLIIDIGDDGAGVSPGAEELIFLRFYQDQGPTLRRGKRGLGLGLFLARHIAERHLGRLIFVRRPVGSLFRFIWPLGEPNPTHVFRRGA